MNGSEYMGFMVRRSGVGISQSFGAEKLKAQVMKVRRRI